MAVKNRDGSIMCSNQAAPRFFRHEVIALVKKLCGEYFENNPADIQTIEVEADRSCQSLEDDYINKHCSRFDMPVFDFFINAPDLD